MCVCACASVSVCLPIKGDSRFGDSLDSCCLLCSLRGDEQMVCWSVVQRTHAGPHTHTQTQIRTCMLDPVTLALSSIYLFHYTSLGRTMPLCELWGRGTRVCLRETERIQGSVNEVANRASQVVIWKSWWLTCTLTSVNHCYSFVSRSAFSKNCL